MANLEQITTQKPHLQPVTDMSGQLIKPAGVSLTWSAAEDFQRVYDVATELNVPYDIATSNYKQLEAIARAEPDPSDMHISYTELAEAKDISPGPAQLSFVSADREKTWLEKFIGYTYPPHPPGWERATPLEKFNYATLPLRDFFTRMGGVMVTGWGLATEQQVKELLSSVYTDTLKWYQKSPELAGWTAKQFAEITALRTLFVATGLSDVLKVAGQKLAAPFITSQLATKGGPTIATLTKQGLKQLGRRVLVDFLLAAPENASFGISWAAADALLKGGDWKQTGLAAIRGAAWSAGWTLGFAAIGEIAKTPEATAIARNAYIRMARKWPEFIDFVTGKADQEITESIVSSYNEYYGTDVRFSELPENIKSRISIVAKELKRQAIRDAVARQHLEQYWTAKVGRQTPPPPPPAPAATAQTPPKAPPMEATTFGIITRDGKVVRYIGQRGMTFDDFLKQKIEYPAAAQKGIITPDGTFIPEQQAHQYLAAEPVDTAVTGKSAVETIISNPNSIVAPPGPEHPHQPRRIYNALKDGIKQATDKLRFFPDIPPEVRNKIRTDVIGASDQARAHIASLEAYCFEGLSDDEIEKAVEIFFAKDQLARTMLRKGNPDVTIQQAEQVLQNALQNASPKSVTAVNKIREIYNAFQKRLVERGLLDEEHLISDYAPHYVVDYTPGWVFNVGLPTRLKRPFRGYTRQAVGTTKEYRKDRQAIFGHLMVIEHDNIIEDFIEKTASQYDVLPMIPAEDRIAMFGEDAAGRPMPPRPGRIYEYEGKRYRAYTPDIPYNRTIFTTEETVTINQIIDTLNLAAEEDTTFEELYPTLLESAKRYRALGKYKNVHLVPEDIYNMFMEFTEPYSGGLYYINRAVGVWKTMAVLSRYLTFNINNLLGDTYAVMIQHPNPLELIKQYPGAINYLLSENKAAEFPELHSFIVRNDVLSGTFTGAETIPIRPSGNPLKWIIKMAQRQSNFRESINRVAYASSMLEAMQNGNGRTMVEYHNWIDTEGLTLDAALGKISRKVLVDYKETSKFFRHFISGGAFPFGTWYFSGSSLMWKWAAKHWGKAAAVFFAGPLVAAFYNRYSEHRRKLEMELPDSVRHRIHFILGETPDGKVRTFILNLPQDALIGTKIFSIMVDYANRVANKEISARDAAILTLRQWGISEAKGIAYLATPIVRFIQGLASPAHLDPYDSAPIYDSDPAKMGWFERWSAQFWYFMKCSVPFLSYSIAEHEKKTPVGISALKWLDRVAGKGAFGIYDIDKKGNFVFEIDGEKRTFTYDQVTQIKYIAAKEEAYLDKIERSFISSGLTPEEFIKTSAAHGPLIKIYRMWSKFVPALARIKWDSDAEKATAVMNILGRRFVNRLTNPEVIQKWYETKLELAKTDYEKQQLAQQRDIIRQARLIKAIKSFPVTGRTMSVVSAIKKSKLPWDLIIETGVESEVQQ